MLSFVTFREEEIRDGWRLLRWLAEGATRRTPPGRD